MENFHQFLPYWNKILYHFEVKFHDVSDMDNSVSFSFKIHLLHSSMFIQYITTKSHELFS